MTAPPSGLILRRGRAVGFPAGPLLLLPSLAAGVALMAISGGMSALLHSLMLWHGRTVGLRRLLAAVVAVSGARVAA